MYKVFYNHRTVFFIQKEIEITEPDNSVLHIYKNRQSLEEELDKFIKNSDLDKLYIKHDDVDFAFNEFSSLFQIIEAAGGLVKNENDEILVIYRRDTWDLPKGKIEDNELPNIAAIREVEEECGISYLEISNLLEITYHTYKLDGKNILKRTYWYEMLYKGDQMPSPQIEEEITEARWLERCNVQEVVRNTFPSILEVLKRGGII